jgi:tRNA G18 (ribose-2'-O)-methylase SpoU
MERSHEPGEFYLAAGVGPHPQPWPAADFYDPELLANGDRRNVQDEFRYLKTEEIKRRLALQRQPVRVAIENWQHDLNIGSLVRTANAFNVSGVHIVGNKRWNQHGALMTDKYLEMFHHADATSLREFAKSSGYVIVGFENHLESIELPHYEFEKASILLFGNEGLGLTDAALKVCDVVLSIPQQGSVRSINASAAGAIALYAWQVQQSKKD